MITNPKSGYKIQRMAMKIKSGIKSKEWFNKLENGCKYTICM